MFGTKCAAWFTNFKWDYKRFSSLIIFLFTMFYFVLFLSPGSSFAQDKYVMQNGITLPSDEEIHKLLVDRVDSLHKNLGMVVGIITPEGRRIISYGKMDEGDNRNLDGETVFEIGSITKVFTALLLADMGIKGEVNLDDPVSRYLPEETKIPGYNGKEITLTDLATHTSGLPFWPAEVPLNEEGAKIMFNYSSEKLFSSLSSYKLKQEPGSKWEYSNLGMGLLGIALCNYKKTDYESLVKELITGPLKMNSTSISVSPDMKKRMGNGHNAELKKAEDWNMSVLPGAGSLHSTVNDLLTFLGCFMEFEKTPLSAAMEGMLKIRRQAQGMEQSLGWWIISFAPGDSGIVTAAGQTLGYTGTIAFDPAGKTGVVILSNGVGTDGGLAWHLLRPAFPVETSAALKSRNTVNDINLEPAEANKYTGKYMVNNDLIISIDYKDGKLIMKSPYTPPEGLILHAVDNVNFFVKEIDIRMKFSFTATGYAENLIISFAGTDTKADKIK